MYTIMYVCAYVCVYIVTKFCTYSLNIQGASRLVGITAGGDFLGPCDQETQFKYVSDFGRLRI